MSKAAENPSKLKKITLPYKQKKQYSSLNTVNSRGLLKFNIIFIIIVKRRIKLKSQLYCKKQRTWNCYKGETEIKILNRWVFRDR